MRQLAALHAFGMRVASASSISTICRVAAQDVTRLLGYAATGILLLSGDVGAETLELVARHGRVPGELLASLGGPPGPLERTALTTRRAQVVRALERASRGHVPERDRLIESGFRSAAVIPVVAGRRAWGVMAVVAKDPQALDRSAVSVLSEVGRTIGVALEKHRLLEVARRQVEDILFFRDVSEWIAGELDLDRLLGRICKNLTRLIDVTQCFILLWDEQRHQLYGVAATPPHDRLLRRVRIKANTPSAAAYAFKHRRPLAIYDAHRDPRANKALVRLFRETSLLAIPLLIRGQANGSVLLAETRRMRRFSEGETARAQTVVNQAALAIENALRHRDAIAARDRAELLLETVRDATSSVDLEETLRRIARRVVVSTSAKRCTILLPDDARRIRTIISHGMSREVRAFAFAHLGRPMTDVRLWSDVLHGRGPLVYRDVAAEGALPPVMARKLQLRACVAVPVRARGEFLAAMITCYPYSVLEPPHEDVRVIEGVASQVALAVQNARAFEEIDRQRTALDALTARTICAQEEERRRIARDLHDGVSQTLTAVKFELERLGRRPDGGEGLSQAVATLSDAIGEVRRICMDLRPSQLDYLGLFATVEWFGRTFARRAGLEVDVEVPDEPPALPPDVEINVYRIIQEALANVAKHARASRAFVRLRVRPRPRRLLVLIRDDGCGFNPSSVVRNHGEGRGMGLLGMSERAHLLGGELHVRSREGAGTTIDVRVPLRPIESSGLKLQTSGGKSPT